MESNECKELPEECWESILYRLSIDNYDELQAPSLVCKQFLSITNRLRRKLVAENKVFFQNRCEALCRAFPRFRNLKELQLCDPKCEGVDDIVDINYIIWKIASSGLNLQSLSFDRLQKPPSRKSFQKLGSTMRSLKILRCCNFLSLRDRDIVAIANSFSSLEELDISYPYYELVSKQYPQLSKRMVTDAGIETLSLKLPALRKVDISGNGGCSDRSLIALSSNCVLLDEIRCTSCPVTGEGLGFVVLHSPNLMSLKAGDFFLSPDSSSTFANSIIYARALRVLDLYFYMDVDRLLWSIAKAGIPLEKLVIESDDLDREEDSGFSLHGLSTFLCACPSLKQLELWYTYFLNDHSMRELCRYLPNVVSTKLFRCANLTHATFYIIAKQCPMVSEIVLEPMHQNGDEFFVMDLESNDRITSVDLSFNWRLTDELLKKVGVFCPNLRTLKIRGCNLLTIEGIGEVLKVCSQIKHLTLGTKHRQLEIFLKEFNNRHVKVECW